jgi:hypothetical protein
MGAQEQAAEARMAAARAAREAAAAAGMDDESRREGAAAARRAAEEAGIPTEAKKETAAERIERIRKERETTQAGKNPDNPKPTEDPGEGMYWANFGGVWRKYKSPTTSSGGGGGGGGGGTVDAAAAAAAAAAAEAAARAAAQAAADKAAEKMAGKMKASDRLTALFTSYGLGSLANFINKRIMDDVSEEMVLVELYDQPEYKVRFPGMASLRGKKRTITEKEYMDIEKQMTQTARFFDLPAGFYDNPDDFGKLIGSEVSAKEYQDRLQVGQDLARAMSPGAKAQLQEFYNVGEGGITAYILEPDRALSLIQKQAKAAQFVGFGREKGFKLEGITAAQAEQLAGTEAYAKLSAQQLQQALGQAAQLRQTQSRLTGIEGGTYNESEALQAVIEGSPEAILASQQRAQREGARFGGGGGVTGTSLRSTPGI